MPRTTDSDFNKALGANIRFARIAAKISQSDLGAALGVSFQQVQKYEKGVDRVSAETLVKLASQLGRTVAQLLDLDEAATVQSVGATREQVAIVAAFGRIASPNVRRRALALVEQLGSASGSVVDENADMSAEPAREAA